MNDSSPYNFFLKTENYQPLINLVNRFSNKIEENQAIIANLTNIIDNKFKLPDQLNESITPSIPTNQELPLSDFLSKKYHLDQIKIEDDFLEEPNPKRQLMIEIEKLKKIKKINDYKNKELFKIYKDYELLIITKILPSLRKDILVYNQNYLKSLKQDKLPLKFDRKTKLWSNYVEYVNSLRKLVSVSQLIIKFFENELSNKDLNHFHSMILTIETLIETIGLSQ